MYSVQLLLLVLLDNYVDVIMCSLHDTPSDVPFVVRSNYVPVHIATRVCFPSRLDRMFLSFFLSLSLSLSLSHTHTHTHTHTSIP